MKFEIGKIKPMNTHIQNKKSIKKFLLTLLLFIFIFQISNLKSNEVFAQQITLSISPPLTEAVIKPGKSILVAYTVSNIGDPVVLSSGVRPFVPQGQFGDLIVEEEFSGPIRFNLENSNIKLSDSFFLPTRQGQQLLLKIRVPEGTPEGDYYYTFFVKNEPGNFLEGATSSQATAVVGSNILITVTESGLVDVQGGIGQFGVIPKYQLTFLGKKFSFFESTDTIPIVLVLNNKGKNLIKPYGTIDLKGNFGERAEFDLIPQNILSQSSRMVIATPSAQLSDVQSSVNLSGFFVGKYTLNTSLNFGIGTENLTSTMSFYAIPFKVIIATFVALAIGILLVKKIGKEE